MSAAFLLEKTRASSCDFLLFRKRIRDHNTFMSVLKIDADALFRAVTATGYKLLAYNLDLESGQITSRTLRPDEVADAPQGPSVKPLPKMGGDLTPKKDALPFGPVPVEPKKKLFGDDDLPKKPAFDNEFFKRDEKKKPDLFADGGFKRESGSKKLAEIFGDAGPRKKLDPFKPADQAETPVPAPAPAPVAQAAKAADDPAHPRIPAVDEAQHIEWLTAFAKECGDPEIRDELLKAMKPPKAIAGFERVLRKHQRMGQQFERWFRRQALLFGETWLSELGVQWELVEKDEKI